MRTYMIALTAVILMASMAGTQERALPLDDIHRVALDALKAFSQLVTDQNYKAMGFESPGEVRDVKLGEPLRVFMVGLSQLQKYQPGEDPSRLVTPLDQMIYPVAVGDRVRSSIIIAKMGEGWQAIEFGSAAIVTKLSELRKSSSDSTRLLPAAYFIVRIQALNLEFLGHRMDNAMMLTPLFDDAFYGFKAGATMPASTVFEMVLPEAKKHDGLPR